ncbi:MAG: GNAT family N-acetyltransferase [bacterium]
MKIRTGKPQDLPFLEQMLFEAFFWHPDQERPVVQEFMQRPEFKKLLMNWGRNGDRAIIAEEKEIPVGAAWYRLWTEKDHSYGFVDADTPELGIGVLASHRSKDMGRALLRALIRGAREDEFRTLSLSVDPGNFALQLYESEGFVKVGESGTSWTMLLRLR